MVSIGPHRSIIEKVKEIRLSEDTNLLSYIVLRGTLLQVERLRGREEEYAKGKRALLEEICERTWNIDLSYVSKVMERVRDALLRHGYAVKLCRFKALHRALVGAQGDFGRVPFEVGLSFDPVLNVPFIPGSSLKGAFRHSLEALLREGGRSGPEVEGVVAAVFGSPEGAGLVGVTDAYPVGPGVGGLLLEPDVVTPHYPGSRSEEEASPNPVPFLTIARGVVFESYIYFNKAIYREESRRRGGRSRRIVAELGTVRELKAREEKNPLQYALFDGDLAAAVEKLEGTGMRAIDAVPWVDMAVLYAFTRGVGAKTSLGYSRFAVVEYRTLGGGP